ncbi:MAG TPA: RNA polymerase sigma factor [Acidobacteriota bacterium]|nr:RNA polymerase sigma factor [Acidobacteriota bacterium]
MQAEHPAGEDSGQVDTADVHRAIDEIYREESRRVFATLIRLIGDFDLAEEALHEAFTAAVEQWEEEGIPANPRAWLVSTGRFKAIDVIRRRKTFGASVAEIRSQPASTQPDIEKLDEAHFRDDHLRLIFTCCHPALPPNTQVALTLREVCGLTTEEIATAFLAPKSTIAQRIVRGKAKIRDAKIPYRVPSRSDLPNRLDSVLSVIYLVFNEGYSASSGDDAIRADLSSEAIHLGRVLLDLLPDPEVMGLLALMLLHESRRTARTTADGDLVLLEDQDRGLWDQDLIAQGRQLVERAMASGRFGTYTLQAAISAVHANAASASQTDWPQIVWLYDMLLVAEPSAVVELNRAVAVAMRDKPEAGLELIDAILARGDLRDYSLAHAARAELCRRAGLTAEARAAFREALALSMQEPQRRFLKRRLGQLG